MFNMYMFIYLKSLNAFHSIIFYREEYYLTQVVIWLTAYLFV